MSNQSKYPDIDPSLPKVFDRIIETVAQVRKDRRSEEFMQAERRREESSKALRELRTREAQAHEAERLAAERQIAERGIPTFINLQPGQPLLTLSRTEKGDT